MENKTHLWNFHTCKTCWYRCKSNVQMCKHMKLHQTKLLTDTFNCHSSILESYKCEYCILQTNLKITLINHFCSLNEVDVALQEVEKYQCYKCDECDFETFSALIFTKHVYSCLQVGVKSSSVVYMDGRKWYKCEHCPYWGKKQSYVRSHNLSKHALPENIHWYRCAQCPYKAKRKSYLVKHITAKHLDPKYAVWFRCERCPLKSKHKDVLDRHISRKHCYPDDMLRCKHCLWEFKSRGGLHKHILNHHSDAVWLQCDYCEFKSKDSQLLKKHNLNRHTDANDIKWFHCEYDQCSYKAKVRGNLNRHLQAKHSDPKDSKIPD